MHLKMITVKNRCGNFSGLVFNRFHLESVQNSNLSCRANCDISIFSNVTHESVTICSRVNVV